MFLITYTLDPLGSGGGGDFLHLITKGGEKLLLETVHTVYTEGLTKLAERVKELFIIG